MIAANRPRPRYGPAPDAEVMAGIPDHVPRKWSEGDDGRMRYFVDGAFEGVVTRLADDRWRAVAFTPPGQPDAIETSTWDTAAGARLAVEKAVAAR